MQITRLTLLLWVVCMLSYSHNSWALNSGNTVIMIGIDGLRPGALETVPAQYLRQLAEEGVKAKSLIPVMPTKTFVNFYSIATGLYPEKHGMVSNAPFDRQLGRKFTASRDVQDPYWWSGEPIWISAEKQGVKAATYFWVGSEVAIDGVQPSYWKPYQQDKDYGERIDEVLAWLDLPEPQRPRLITLYFSAVDTAVHRYGLDTPQERDAILRVDGHIGTLLAGLSQRNLGDTTNIVVVSDHGMVDVSAERLINLDNWLDLSDWTIPEWQPEKENVSSPFLSLFGDAQQVAKAYQVLHAAHPSMQVYRRGEHPAHYHFEHPQRVPDLLVLAQPGWQIFASRKAANKGKVPQKDIRGATHGYDSQSTQMQAVFIASGPDFVAASEVDAFENIEVYGMLACILGIKPAKTDGDVRRVAHLLKKNCQY